MLTSRFEYTLPAELIAQTPLDDRDKSRMMVVDRATRSFSHRHFSELPEILQPGDVVVMNNTRVIPARCHGVKVGGSARFEVFFTKEIAPNRWWAMIRPGKRAQVGTEITLLNHRAQPSEVRVRVLDRSFEGLYRLECLAPQDIKEHLRQLGEAPLPPYIRLSKQGFSAQHLERYQTVYAATPGSVAAPTAGLHFTSKTLDHLNKRGIRTCYVTLHVGTGTFSPVKTESVEDHRMHSEWFELPAEAVQTIESARATGGAIVSVGTTTLRVLETVAARNEGRLVPGTGATSLFVYPPRSFQIVHHLLTNFHLPKSTLLMLVSAFASPGNNEGVDFILAGYREAMQHGYRFYSYGDCVLIR